MKFTDRIWLLVLVVSLMLIMSPVMAQGDVQTFPQMTVATNTIVPPTEQPSSQPSNLQPAPAPETVTIDNGVGNDVFVVVVIAGSAIIVGLLIAYGYSQGKSTTELAKAWPPEAMMLIRAVPEFGLDKARQTETPLDDEGLKRLAEVLGYDVQVAQGGRIVLVPRASPPDTAGVG